MWDSIPGSAKSDAVSPATCLRCDVSSELCCLAAKPRRMMSLTARYSLRRNTASVMRIFVFCCRHVVWESVVILETGSYGENAALLVESEFKQGLDCVWEIFHVL